MEDKLICLFKFDFKRIIGYCNLKEILCIFSSDFLEIQFILLIKFKF